MCGGLICVDVLHAVVPPPQRSRMFALVNLIVTLEHNMFRISQAKACALLPKPTLLSALCCAVLLRCMQQQRQIFTAGCVYGVVCCVVCWFDD